MSHNFIVTVDGSAERRRMRCGYVIRDADTGKIVETGSKDLGRGTNNVAEYLAVIEGCLEVRWHAFNKVTVYTDSQLVVRQLKGEYRVTSKGLRSLHRRAIYWLHNLQAKLVWHRRDEGDGPLADSLASGRSQEESNGTRNQVDKGGHREEASGGAKAERVPAH